MRICPAAVCLFASLASLALIGCGSDTPSGTTASGSGGGMPVSTLGDDCSQPIVFTDAWKGTNNFTEQVKFGKGSIVPYCAYEKRPAVFMQWVADKTEPDNFKVLVNGADDVTLIVFAGDTCSNTPIECTEDMIPVSQKHVAGTYVPVTDGQPITIVIAAKEDKVPTGTFDVSMGD